MCRFVRDGEPDIGEYRELADGTGICVLADMNGDSEEVVVSLPDGTMPEKISDLELLKVPTTMHGPESGPLTPAEVAERMIKGNNDCGPHRFPGAGHNQPIINQPIINQC